MSTREGEGEGRRGFNQPSFSHYDFKLKRAPLFFEPTCFIGSPSIKWGSLFILKSFCEKEGYSKGSEWDFLFFAIWFQNEKGPPIKRGTKGITTNPLFSHYDFRIKREPPSYLSHEYTSIHGHSHHTWTFQIKSLRNLRIKWFCFFQIF